MKYNKTRRFESIYSIPALTITGRHFTMKSNKMTKILDRIDNPGDLKNLTYPELKQLAAEIREELVAVVSANGGHLASNRPGIRVEIQRTLSAAQIDPHPIQVQPVGIQLRRLPRLRRPRGRTSYFARPRRAARYPR